MITKKWKAYTNEEKAFGLSRCFWWFVGLLLLNVGSFWVPLVWGSTSPKRVNGDLLNWIMMMGMGAEGVLSIIFIYYFARLRGKEYVWILWTLAALFPFTAPLAFLLLCNSAYSELRRTGSRAILQIRFFGTLFSVGSMILIFSLLILSALKQGGDHERLMKSGKPITGSLQMVTKHTVDFIPTGYSFTVSYAGRSKELTASRKMFLENTLPNGTFTHHEIALIYLPDDPRVVEFAGSSGAETSGWVIGGLAALLGGSWLYRVIKTKFPKNTGDKTPPNSGGRLPARSFIVDKRGEAKSEYR